jgi:GNAT superfamily N-acetyltransferase
MMLKDNDMYKEFNNNWIGDLSVIEGDDQYLKENFFFVCWFDDLIVGMAHTMIGDGLSDDLVYLRDFYILEEFRNRGFGSLLLDEVKNYCIEISRHGIFLDVIFPDGSNTGVRKGIFKFIEKQGFVKRSEKDISEYNGGMDEYVYWI